MTPYAKIFAMAFFFFEMLFKYGKICYNANMENKRNKQQGTVAAFLGEPTPAKLSGLTFSVTSIAAVAWACLFTVILIVCGVADNPDYTKSEWYLYCSFLITPLAFALSAVLLLRWSKTPLKTELQAQKCHPKYFIVAIILQIGLLGLSELNVLFLEFLGRFGYVETPIELPSMNGFGFVGVLFAVAVLPAIFEEWIFRGFLLKGMRTFGTAGAVLLSGALFSLFHQNPAQTIYQFCCGAAFALVAVRSGSILPTMLAHFINNALILTLTKFGIMSFPTPVFIAIVCVSGVCLIGSLGWLLFVDKKPIPQSLGVEEGKKERKRFWLAASAGLVICGVSWLSALLMGL